MIKTIAIAISLTAVSVQANEVKIKPIDEYNKCVQRGYDYYDELGYGKGNYKLINGRWRNDQVAMQCSRQPKTAFWWPEKK